ncbi:preprotein translocase subunit SecE [Candidatus Wolfebacteria bacterium]|nr:preprotein translocase subunit SecE [Candidatus Wolfebacteria bacterium]
MFSRLKTYILESRQEFRRVNWPSREETTRLTLIVIGMSIALSVFLGVLDVIFRYGLEILILK